MTNFSFVPVVIVLLFLLLPVATYVLERVRRRFDPTPPAGQRVPDMGIRRQAAAPILPSSTQRERARPADNAQGSQRRPAKKATFKTPADLRRVIVAMTILGPCRANEPDSSCIGDR